LSHGLPCALGHTNASAAVGLGGVADAVHEALNKDDAKAAVTIQIDVRDLASLRRFEAAPFVADFDSQPSLVVRAFHADRRHIAVGAAVGVADYVGHGLGSRYLNLLYVSTGHFDRFAKISYSASDRPHVLRLAGYSYLQSVGKPRHRRFPVIGLCSEPDDTSPAGSA